jgi:hypothetical protein
MINELEIQRYDNMFGTHSKVFGNIIIVDSAIDEWCIEVTNRQIKGVCLLHKNKRGRKNRFHIQGFKSNLYQAYDSIYSHKHVLSCVSRNKIISPVFNKVE